MRVPISGTHVIKAHEVHCEANADPIHAIVRYMEDPYHLEVLGGCAEDIIPGLEIPRALGAALTIAFNHLEVLGACCQ